MYLKTSPACARSPAITITTPRSARLRFLLAANTSCPHLHSYPQAPELHGVMRSRLPTAHRRRRDTAPKITNGSGISLGKFARCSAQRSLTCEMKMKSTMR